MKINQLYLKTGYFKCCVFLLLLSIITGCKTPSGGDYYLRSEYRRVHSGLEVFLRDHAAKYKGDTDLLVTNHSGVNYNLTHNIFLLRKSGIIIKDVLAPEHGLYGHQQNYSKKFSLYNKKLKVNIFNMHKMQKKNIKDLFPGADIIIFDIQDMGMRCYTYISNLKLIMDCLRGSRKELIVLDRPNPIGFLGVDGAYLSDRFKSRFVSAFPATMIYAMTMGESALYYRGEFAPKVRVKVIPMENYEREMYYHETSMPWVPPSPNLPTYHSSLVYTFIVMLEGINFSIGRGTSNPFENIGAPWIKNPETFAEDLKDLDLGPFRFRPIYFKPYFSKYKKKSCGGVQIFYTGGDFSPTETAYKLLSYLFKNHKGKVFWSSYKGRFSVDYLAGNDLFRKYINSGKPYRDYHNAVKKGIRDFNYKRNKYTLY